MTNDFGLKMKDIARLSGVSRQTVSAVLNGKEWVSQETRDKVMRVIREHNYTPNLHAMSLAGKSSRLIGVVLRDISNPFYTQLALGVESVLRTEGYGLLYYNTFEDHEREVRAINELMAYRADGVIISPVAIGVDLSHLWHLKERHTPFVSIDRIPGLLSHSIDFENEQASYTATKHLLDHGHRRIAYLSGPESASSALGRLTGFKSCLVDHGIPVSGELIVPAGTLPEERIAVARRLLKSRTRRPTAILCFNDLVAITVYRVAHDLKLRIPDDISVVGFDDIEIAALLAPALTTSRLDSREAGTEAARILLKDISGEQKEIVSKTYRPPLIVRESVKSIISCSAV